MKFKSYISCSFLFFIAYLLKAQDSFSHRDSSKYDTIRIQPIIPADSVIKDSLRLYKSIHSFAQRRKITMLLYQLVFNDNHLYPVKIAPSQPTFDYGPWDNFELYTGKIIRDVKIISLDPFGASVYDTTLKRNDFAKNAANKFHIKSNRITIRNRLLFKSGDEVDPLRLRESERLLRSAGYIRDAKVMVEPLKTTSDSVDILVVSQDRWSIVVSGIVSPGSTRFILTEKNFAGWGHYFRNNLIVDYADPFNPKVNGTYSTSYIRKTFISVTGNYSNELSNQFMGLSMDRPFYSPLAKWAGGAGYLTYNTTVSYLSLNDSSAYQNFPLTYEQKDFWIGRSFQLLKGKLVSAQSTRFIISGSYLDRHYIRRPSVIYDSARVHTHAKQYLAAIGLTNQQYYKDRYIYRFGEAEDVPTGRLFALIGGLEQKELFHRYYTGIKAAAGNHIDGIGNLAVSAEYATFFRDKIQEEGVLNFDVNYFTDRWKLPKWSGRQFAFFRFTKGYNRPPSDKIFINDNNGLYGFKSATLSGNRKIFLNLISVVYTPLKFLGFKFAAMVFGSFGTVATTHNELLKSRIYQGYGLGLLIRNDQLVVKSFELSIGIYPFLPESSNPAFRFDVISPSDIRFKDYGLSRPGTISYQ